MYVLNLDYPEENFIDQIQKNEFVYAVLNENNDVENIQKQFLYVKMLSSKNKKIYLYAGKAESLETSKALDENEIRWVGIDVNVGIKGHFIDTRKTVYSNIDQSAVECFSSVRNRFKVDSGIIPEFIWNSSYSLGPTILEFFDRFKLPFAFIRVSGGPEPRMVREIQEAFEYLRLRGTTSKIYFNFDNWSWDLWNKKTLNTFSGLELVHVDLSNKCTHSCVFCGLWGNEFIEQQKKNGNGRLSSDLIDFMSKQISKERALEILESVPETVKTVQFGGAGDPLTHPDWFEIITSWREKGAQVEVLTNFEYPSHEQIKALHHLCQGKRGFEFLINVSAATVQTYLKIRPRQNLAAFETVISNIKYAKNLRDQDGHGLRIIMLHVINRFNYHEVVDMVDLAHSLGAALYLKPLEVHGELHRLYSIPKTAQVEFKKLIKKAINRVDELKVELFFREMIEEIAVD